MTKERQFWLLLENTIVYQGSEYIRQYPDTLYLTALLGLFEAPLQMLQRLVPNVQLVIQLAITVFVYNVKIFV